MSIIYKINTPSFDGCALKALFNNLEQIISHQDLIISHRQYRDIAISGCGAYPLYTPPLSLFLGDLLQLWQCKAWRIGNEYFYFSVGSPLSGSNESRFWSTNNGFGIRQLPSMLSLLRPAYTLINEGKVSFDCQSFCTSIKPRTASELTIFDLLEHLHLQY